MIDSKLLYKCIGRKIRDARKRASEKPSQAALAGQLGISRVSVVNIEAGRQQAPLHVLWRIAEALEIDITTLLPTRAELMSTEAPVNLTAELRDQIRSEAGGDPAVEKALTNIVGKILPTIESKPKK
jgi:transcriptional regulator with XRE-family HTH domain